MKVETHRRLSRPSVLEATRLVAYDADGNPLLLAVQLDDAGRAHHVSRRGDEDFEVMLTLLGVRRTQIVTNVLDPGDLPTLTL